MTTKLLISKPDIPRSALVTTSQGTYADDHLHYNAIRGRRHCITKLGAAATREWVQYDLGLGVTGSANHLIIARADMLQSDGVNCVTLTGSAGARTAPTDCATQPTLWLDAEQSVTAADTAVSAWASRVGAVSFAQATAGNKPAWTRADNLENRALYSEAFNSWTKSNVTVSDDTVDTLDPLGGSHASRIIESAAVTTTYSVYQEGIVVTAGDYRLKFWAKKGERYQLYVYTASNIGGSPATAINLDTGGVTPEAGTTATTVSAGNGWYLVTISGTVAAGTNARPRFFVASDAGALSHDGDAAKGLYLFGAHLQSSLADSTYLPTTTYAQFRGINGHRALHFSGAQYMTSTDAALLASVAGEDTPNTLFAVSRHALVTGNEQDYLAFYRAATPDNSFLFWAMHPAAGRRYKRAGSGGPEISIIGAVPSANTVDVWCAVFDGAVCNLYKNNVQDGAANQADNTTTMNAPSIAIVGANYYPSAYYSFLNGDLCEIVLIPGALSSADRTAVYNYLAARYLTAPSYQSLTFNTATLYGPNAADFITTFTASTAYRYWWLDYAFGDGVTTSTFPRSKEYFGTAVDLGVNPSAYNYKCPAMTTEKQRYPLGQVKMGHANDAKYQFSVEWSGVSDANAARFLTELLKDPITDRLFLYTSGNDSILADKILAHVMIKPDGVSIARRETAAGAGWNIINADFEEELG